MSIALSSIIVIIGLLAGGRLGFSFFPQPEGTNITATIRFISGTPQEKTQAFVPKMPNRPSGRLKSAFR